MAGLQVRAERAGPGPPVTLLSTARFPAGGGASEALGRTGGKQAGEMVSSRMWNRE